jgi:aspartyl aminopeptidase
MLDGTQHLTATGPLLRFPQLAIHLDRNVNDGLTLDKQRHMNPVWGLGNPADSDLLSELASHVPDAAVDPALIGGYDVVIADTQAPAVFGANSEFFASGRLDNLSATHAGLVALIASSSVSGGADAPIAVLAASFCVSADAGHAVHPNYAERHDPANHPVLHGGPLLKINANQRYATDAAGAAFWARLCSEAKVPYQEFVSNNGVPCGSTIGPLTATRLGIRTVDVGVPLLSMHSARELCGVEDPAFLTAVAKLFFRTEA